MKNMRIKDAAIIVESPKNTTQFNLYGSSTDMSIKFDTMSVHNDRPKFGSKEYKLPFGHNYYTKSFKDMTARECALLVESPVNNTVSTYQKPEDLEGWVHEKVSMGDKWTKITKVKYKDYTAKQVARSFTWIGEVDTAKESFASLLISNGFTPETCAIALFLPKISDREAADIIDIGPMRTCLIGLLQEDEEFVNTDKIFTKDQSHLIDYMVSITKWNSVNYYIIFTKILNEQEIKTIIDTIGLTYSLIDIPTITNDGRTTTRLDFSEPCL
jgi:hypothetical protein